MQTTEIETTWSQPPDKLDLKSDQVDVWRIELDLPPDTVKLLESTLSADESQRAENFHFPKDRDRYILAHSALREILSHYLACGPGQLIFSKNKYGKPALDSSKLKFNLSHSGNFALIAVTWEQNVGIDVEHIRSDLEFESLARHFFSPNEVAELMALPLEKRKFGFFNCWTRKEAYIKAQGLGLSMPLEGFDVSLAPDEPALLRRTRIGTQGVSGWSLFALDVDPEYIAALAVEGIDLIVKFWNWKPSTL